MEKVFRNLMEFESEELKRHATFQLCIDELARDLYFEEEKDSEKEKELNFDD
ncbi:MAG: hypothetical protein PHU25_12570 [Deltaproteobacteria bacterium]|nr:hypothetical protein [Deltaproteobacteria bacterium]